VSTTANVFRCQQICAGIFRIRTFCEIRDPPAPTLATRLQSVLFVILVLLPTVSTLQQRRGLKKYAGQKIANFRQKKLISARNFNFKFRLLIGKLVRSGASNLGNLSKRIRLLLYCMLHTNSPGGSNDAVARQVYFAQISCFKFVKTVKCELSNFGKDIVNRPIAAVAQATPIN